MDKVTNFKIDISIQANGDIVEDYYFAPDKSDMLSFASASGMQSFLATIAIKEALHSSSKLTKPSLCIIDEGFGTLDNETIIGVQSVMDYLKGKHKNVIIVTHRMEIKDYVDHSIDVVKTTEGINEEVMAKNPDAGTTKLSIS